MGYHRSACPVRLKAPLALAVLCWCCVTGALAQSKITIPGGGGAIKSSPVSLGGYVYFGDGVGQVYCRNTLTGQPGWTFNTRTRGGSISSLVLGRPSINSIGGVLYLFFTTNDGFVFCVNATTGEKVWSTGSPLLASATAVDTTPAVITGPTLADTVVYASVYKTVDGRVFKRRGDDGSALAKSDNLFGANGTNNRLSSPAAWGGGVYVSAVGGLFAGYRLNPENLEIGAGLASGLNSGTPPYIYHYEGIINPIALITMTDGSLGAYNASNGGQLFVRKVASTALTSPVTLGRGDVVYVAGADGVIYHARLANGLPPEDSVGYEFFSGAKGYAIQGLTADPAGINAQPTLLFGAANGCFYQVPLANPASVRCTATPGSGKAYVTTPTIDAAGTGTDLIGNDDGNVYGFARR